MKPSKPSKPTKPTKSTKPTKDILFVSIQLILFTAYLFRIPELDVTIPSWLQYTGLLLAALGVILAPASVIALRNSLSVFPTPKDSAELIQSGIYKYIRHPIYTGILLFTFGFSIFSMSGFRSLIFLSLLILFKFKATYEEKLLQSKFVDYDQYKTTTGMFLPRFFMR